MHRSLRRWPAGGTQVARLPAALGLVAVCASAITLAACGGGTPAPGTSLGHGSSPKAQTPAASALAGYRDMWAGLVTAAATSDYQSPLLAQHATGAALTLLVQGLARDQLHDIVTRGVTVHHPVVTSLSPAAGPNRATVADCFDDSNWIEYTTAGKPAKNAPGGRRKTAADLTKAGGTWKVSELTVGATGTC